MGCILSEEERIPVKVRHIKTYIHRFPKGTKFYIENDGSKYYSKEQIKLIN
jgi:hypothetical protein